MTNQEGVSIVIDPLINNIKTLKTNSDYRICDIINKRGRRWEHSLKMVLQDTKYDNSILKNYLTKNPKNELNISLFYECIKDFKSKRKNIKVPSSDELVIHLRLGDIVTNEWFKKTEKHFPQKLANNINAISQKNTFKKITIVTCFAYQAWSKECINYYKGSKKPADWGYTNEKQLINYLHILNILNTIRSECSEHCLDIVSNRNPDLDIIYCTYSNLFLLDSRTPYGGFSALLNETNKLHSST